MCYCYEHPRPALMTDCVVFGLADEDLKILLIQRDKDPYTGKWALPGGFARVGESLEETARRKLEEETGLCGLFLEQLYTFSQPERDPREHVVSVAYFALTNLDQHFLKAASDAQNAAWFEIHGLPSLAFDHEHVLKIAYQRLRGKIKYQPIGFELLSEKFTLGQMQKMYEKILGRSLDKRNFRKKILKMDILRELQETQTDVAHRAARLYQFDKAKYDRMVKEGFNFEI